MLLRPLLFFFGWCCSPPSLLQLGCLLPSFIGVVLLFPVSSLEKCCRFRLSPLVWCCLHSPSYWWYCFSISLSGRAVVFLLVLTSQAQEGRRREGQHSLTQPPPSSEWCCFLPLPLEWCLPIKKSNGYHLNGGHYHASDQ